MLSYLHGSGLRIVANQEHLHCAIFLHGQWQCEVAERVKSDRHFGALRADQCGLEQAMEDIHNDGIITQPMVLPCLFSHNLSK